MEIALLDTDILSELLKQRNARVKHRAARYARAHGQFAISAFTKYEMDRGYRESGATRQRARFDTFCQNSIVLPITEEVLSRAADLWVLARRGGHSHNDADLIIAATALVAGRTLVTGNTSHFASVPNLRVQDWRKL